jgi:hypothetical protein
MVVRMTRKMFVLVLAALGVQYLRVIARVIVHELRPQSSPELELAAARVHAERQLASTGAGRARQGLFVSTLEPHGAI